MCCLAAWTDDIIFFPLEIFDARELTGQCQMLFERCERAFEGLGIDSRDVRSPEEVSKALSLGVEFWHGGAPS
jgi:hypothetical protein